MVEKGRGPGALRLVVSGAFCIATWRNVIFKEPWYFVKLKRVVLIQWSKQSLNPSLYISVLLDSPKPFSYPIAVGDDCKALTDGAFSCLHFLGGCKKSGFTGFPIQRKQEQKLGYRRASARDLLHSNQTLFYYTLVEGEAPSRT